MSLQVTSNANWKIAMARKIIRLPLSALTENDRAARKAPPIYVIIADQYGIRAITVNGEII